MDVDWRGCYNLLAGMGMTDKEIGELAGVTRVTVNRVRNHQEHAVSHNPMFDRGMEVLKTLRAAQRQGKVSAKELARVGLK